MADRNRRLATMGGGPLGLDAALACAEVGLLFIPYESKETVSAHVSRWGHMGMFTPWRMTISHRMRAHLSGAGVRLSRSDEVPTGADLVTEVLRPLRELPVPVGRIRLGAHVLGVARRGLLKHEQVGTEAPGAAPFRWQVDESFGSRSEGTAARPQESATAGLGRLAR